MSKEDDILFFLAYEKMCADEYRVSEEQKKLITRLKQVGYGYALFAESVEKSGKCSPAQHRKLQEMVDKTKGW